MNLHPLLAVALAALFTLLIASAVTGAFAADYKSPSTGKLSLPWSVKVFLEHFSTASADRWYESIAHCKQGAFISLLSALHLVYVVRLEFVSMTDSCSGRYILHHYHGFRSFDTLKHLLLNTPSLYRHSDEEYMYDQTFVAGHNVIQSWMHFDSFK